MADGNPPDDENRIGAIYAARGAGVGFLLGLAIWGSKAINGIELEGPWTCVAVISGVGAAFGFLMGAYRARNCPLCGRPMGKAHGLSNKRTGEAYYHCERCKAKFPLSVFVGSLPGRRRPPPDKEGE
jgi:hypothetical protein